MYCRPSALAKEVANFFAYGKEINILLIVKEVHMCRKRLTTLAN